MSLDYIYKGIPFIIPEIILSAVIVILLLLDSVIRKKIKIIHYFAFAGFLLTGYFIIQQFSINGSAFVASGNAGMITVDPFGTFMKLIIIGSSAFIVLFNLSSYELRKESKRIGEYYLLLSGMILGMLFLVSATDLILIYVSLELMSLSSYVLAGFTRTTPRSSEASLKYIIYGGIASGITLFGISILFGLTGSTNLYEINTLLKTINEPSLLTTITFLFIFTGIGFKISTVPFHFWTPDVYEGAPLPITAFLSVASKTAGFAFLIRFVKITFFDSTVEGNFWSVLPVFDWQMLLILISVLTMTLGNFAALWQKNVKRMLAYSSIAQAGYILLAFTTFSNEGMMALIIYLAIYMVMNLGAFYVVLQIANKTGSEELDDYNGLGYLSPISGVALTIFLIALTGLPPTAGFIAKLYLFMALVDAEMITVSVIALLNSVVSLYYYIRILKHMYLNKPEKESKFEISIENKIVIIVLTIPVIIFGVYFTPLIELARYSISIFGF